MKIVFSHYMRSKIGNMSAQPTPLNGRLEGFAPNHTWGLQVSYVPRVHAFKQTTYTHTSIDTQEGACIGTMLGETSDRKS